jgi:hypothetical protein
MSMGRWSGAVHSYGDGFISRVGTDQTLWIQAMAIRSHKTGKGVLTDKSNPTV